jgi:hypothetical protein
MDFETLYNMAADAARNAERMCSQRRRIRDRPVVSELRWLPALHRRRIQPTARVRRPGRLNGSDVLPTIDLGKDRSPADVTGPMWKSYAELAAVRLIPLASYLQSKLGIRQQEHEQIIDLINANLRASIYHDPRNERDVGTCWRQPSALGRWTSGASKTPCRTSQSTTYPTSLSTGSAFPSR